MQKTKTTTKKNLIGAWLHALTLIYIFISFSTLNWSLKVRKVLNAVIKSAPIDTFFLQLFTFFFFFKVHVYITVQLNVREKTMEQTYYINLCF